MGNQAAARHEFIRGEIFAIAGTTDRHNEITGNLYMMLRQHLRGTPCRAFIANTKVRVEAANCCFSPDLMVTCTESDHADRYVKLVVEVLSESTAAFDLGDKFAAYRQLDSLREYVLVDQERIRVQIYRRLDGQWWVDSVGPGERLHLESIDFECLLEKIHEDLSEPLGVGPLAPERLPV